MSLSLSFLLALTALCQMAFAGFFVHLDVIPPVLWWLEWLCPLKYTLKALSDMLEGVPINVSASLIMNLAFIYSGLNTSLHAVPSSSSGTGGGKGSTAVCIVAITIVIWRNHALEKAMSNTADVSETVYIHETQIIENVCFFCRSAFPIIQLLPEPSADFSAKFGFGRPKKAILDPFEWDEGLEISADPPWDR
ncbi:hypothetical protein C8J56DRAFT_899660 [Mycena floridula]|nr:hypothetical protein C8J56DRAFT_899649 [Mycena floridula]KAJ7576549.1 hypothetical protein C8J56DRAFT_899660 [Mycena floridula]